VVNPGKGRQVERPGPPSRSAGPAFGKRAPDACTTHYSHLYYYVQFIR
jgi:hypothetical protein